MLLRSQAEMLLHTNEGVGPHTKTTLHYIEDLKNGSAPHLQREPAA